MPTLSRELHAALQNEVITTYQRGKRSSQKVTANQLAMYFSTGHLPRLAEATVHRFFNLDALTTPSPHTLNTLAQYAGFKDFADFSLYFEEQNDMLLRGMRSERLEQSFGLMQRLRGESGEALAASLRAAAGSVRTPAGQDDWMQAWVDLAYLPGYFGQLLEIYRGASGSSEAQIFAGGLLYLRALLTENRTECEVQAKLLWALDPRHSTPSFVLGRWAFAQLIERGLEDSSVLTDAELAVLRERAPTISVGAVARPVTYNYFPAGYHFLVAEALFLSQQWAALASWVVETESALAQLGFKALGNVFGEVLSAWQAVALHYTGQTIAGKTAWQTLQPSLDKPENRWLWDYYEVYLWLIEFVFTTNDAKAKLLRKQVDGFAVRRGMPLFSSYLNKL